MIHRSLTLSALAATRPLARRVLRGILLPAIALGITLSSVPLAAFAQDYIPPNRGLPGRREGGGTRGCWSNPTVASGQTRLTAIVPAQNLGYTLSEYPTFFVYVPAFYAEKAAAAELILSDDQDNEIYRTSFSTSDKSGMIRISLPADANMAPLEVGRDYHWSFALVCDPNDPSGNLVVDSWIQRIQPSSELSAALEQAEPADLPALYARAGVWYDAIANLTDPSQRSADPGMITQWQNLLNSVGLDSIAAELPTASTSSLPRRLQP